MKLISTVEAYEKIKETAKTAAEAIQAKSSEMTGTEINEAAVYIPDFKAAIEKKNMLERTAGQEDGFVCKSSAGRVVRLIQNYDSRNYLHDDNTPWEPEELPAQWRFVWSKDPKHARPFIMSAESYYNTGDCCLNEAGEPKRSKIENNVWSPDTNPEYWEDAI